MVAKPHPDDLIVWPDGTQCTRAELPEMTFMSDDYYVIPVDEIPTYEDHHGQAPN